MLNHIVLSHVFMREEAGMSWRTSYKSYSRDHGLASKSNLIISRPDESCIILAYWSLCSQQGLQAIDKGAHLWLLCSLCLVLGAK